MTIIYAGDDIRLLIIIQRIIITKSKFDQAWEDNYHLLEKFISEFNRLPKRDDIYYSVKLGLWCENQKRRAVVPGYPEYRLERLKNIGLFDPSKSFLGVNWEENYKLLKKYIAEYNRFPSYEEIYQGNNIGSWYYSQKRLMKRSGYPKEHLQKINALGISECSLSQESWIHNFHVLKAFISEYDRLPKQKEEYQGIKIGLWCSKQKQKAKQANYPKEYFHLLSEVGLLYSDAGKNRQKPFNNILWDEKYQLLVKFISDNNRIPSKTEVYENVKIGSWLNEQKKLLKNPEYPPERRKKLAAIGITKSSSRNDIWEKHLQDLLTFKQEFNRLPNKPDIYNGFHIGEWWRNIVLTSKNPNFPKDRMQKLIESGLWPIENSEY